MVLKLTIDRKALEGKTPEEQLIIIGDTIVAEIGKDALSRDNAGIAALQAEFTAKLKTLEENFQKRYAPISVPGTEAGVGKDQFSMARAAVFVKTGNAAYAPYEVEVFKETAKIVEQRAAVLGIDASAGFMAPTEVSSKFIEKLLPQVIAFQLGVNDVDVGNVAELSFNRETGTATAQWVGEMVSAAKSQVKLGRMSVSPKALSAKGDISNLVQLLGSNAGEERFVRSATRQFALAIDRAILIGAASDEGPIGICNTIGIQRASSASITLNKIIAFITALRKADALVGSKLGWAMTPDQLEQIEIMTDAANQPLVRRAVDGGTMDRLRGYPFQTTTQMGTTGINTLAFGAWDQASFFRWFGGILMKRTDTSDSAIDNDSTRIALRMYGDVGVDQPSAFCFASD